MIKCSHSVTDQKSVILTKDCDLGNQQKRGSSWARCELLAYRRRLGWKTVGTVLAGEAAVGAHRGHTECGGRRDNFL